MNHTIIHKGIIYLAAVFIMAAAASSCSSSPASINTGPDGIAMKGYDPVAYFTMGQPVKGVRQFVYKWNGADWLFSTRVHLDLFAGSPGKYVPQYGGY